MIKPIDYLFRWRSVVALLGGILVAMLMLLAVLSAQSRAQTTTLEPGQAFAAGVYHSLAVKNDGTVWAWGRNNYGQLGDGTTTDSTTPVQVKGLTGVVDVAAGTWHSLALKNDGTVWAWGHNNYGQLGDGSATDSLTPVQVGQPYNPFQGVKAVAAGYEHSLALKNDGSMWAWGANDSGQLGIQATNPYYTSPMSVDLKGTLLNPGPKSVVDMDAGGSHSLAIATDGTVWTWGRNNYGQLGLGHTNNRDGPVKVSGLAGMQAIAGGANHSLAVKNDGTVWAWGENIHGQLGDGTTTNRLTPGQVSGLTNVKAVAGGSDYSLALKNDGTVSGWGGNNSGQLGDGTTSRRTTPVEVSGLTRVMNVEAGYDHSLARRYDRAVWAWGDNQDSQLGDGTTINRTTPVEVSGLAGRMDVEAGYNHSLALKYDGTVWAWGANNSGQIGDGTTINRLTPVQVSGLTNVKAVAGGSEHSLALKNDGTVWAWGKGSGITPAKVSGLTDVKAIDASTEPGGQANGLALKNDGTVWAWGTGTSPVQISNLSSVTAIAAGGYHSLALKEDGTVWAWGDNGYHQLGIGVGNPGTPVQPTVMSDGQAIPLSGVKAIAAGGYHSLAIKEDGSVWAWGDNYVSQLGDGTTTTTGHPVQVHGFDNVGVLSGVTDVEAGVWHSLAIKEDGTVLAWGHNPFGELGDGTTTTPRSTPVQVHGYNNVGVLSDVKAIAGGAYHSLALKNEGTSHSSIEVLAWGSNQRGQIGDGGTTYPDRTAPVQVLGGLAGGPQEGTTPPQVTQVVPADEAIGVSRGKNVIATFSEEMNATTINQGTFTLEKEGTTTPVAAKVSYKAATNKATLNPEKPLEKGATYIATVSTSAKDLAGNQLDQDHESSGDQPMEWFFTVKN